MKVRKLIELALTVNRHRVGGLAIVVSCRYRVAAKHPEDGVGGYVVNQDKVEVVAVLAVRMLAVLAVVRPVPVKARPHILRAANQSRWLSL